VTIIGGGLAGAAAASGLGGRALLLERETGAHDKICGEFLSHEAGHTLAALGFDAGRLGGAPISRVRLHHGRRSAEAALPFLAHGLTRRTLDAALLDHAAARGAAVRRGVTVRGLVAGQAGDGTALTSEGDTEAGPLLLATGKHDLRGMARTRDGTIDDLIGFKMFFRADKALAARLAGHVDVTLFEGGYAGLQPVEGGRVNLCLLVERERFKALGGTWVALFAALLREPSLAALGGAEPLLGRPLSISNVPYGYLAPPHADGPWRLGDQAAVIPSFCGDGMAMALHSGHLAATMLTDGADASAFQARLRRDTARQVRLATTVQRVATTKAGRFATMAGLSAVPGAMGLLARWTRVRAAEGALV
jgi:flavin-dependent dehydrogenase